MAKNKDLIERKYDALVATVVANIRAVRNRRGYTQEKLGELSGLGRIRIVEIEGRRYAPTLATLNTLAAALGVEVYQFLMPNADDVTIR
jgi:transcriptional regulator with XRE-family HTH domain